MERGQGLVIPCLIEIKDNVTNPSCKQFLTKMASIVFSDYRLIYKFTDACGEDISRLKCGRMDVSDDVSIASGFLLHAGFKLKPIKTAFIHQLNYTML